MRMGVSILLKKAVKGKVGLQVSESLIYKQSLALSVSGIYSCCVGPQSLCLRQPLKSPSLQPAAELSIPNRRPKTEDDYY